MFFAHFHKPSIVSILTSYLEGLGQSYYLYADKNASDEEAGDVLTKFIDTAETYNDELHLAISAELQRYVNYYLVSAYRDPDEYKLIYFVGSRLAAFLEREGHALCGKVVQHSMVLMLDKCLQKATNGKGRPELKKRLIRLITDGKIDEYLGRHGMYLIYKCTSNMMNEQTEAKDL